MVVGLDIFTEHFKDYRDQYILIGGAASDRLMEEAGLTFRATKDLDIVLCVEVLDPGFVKHFWEFIKLGGYQVHENSSGNPCFYRFTHPEDESFPAMIELFSRKPDQLKLSEDAHLTPIPVGDEISSLSAILLNDEYYDFLLNYQRDINGLRVLDEKAIIPLKAKAWTDLTQKRSEGVPIQSGDIDKHRRDVFRLAQLLLPEDRMSLPGMVLQDMQLFCEEIILPENRVDVSQLGIEDVTFDEAVEDLKTNYGIE